VREGEVRRAGELPGQEGAWKSAMDGMNGGEKGRERPGSDEQDS
jgi:hypothetical protein